MTDHDEDLADIDLHGWRVPPPRAVDRSALLVRALSPAAPPARRARMGWILAAIVIVNAVIATLVVILLARAPVSQQTVQVAGGGSVDAQVRDLLQRLEQEQRDLEQKLAENRELRALVLELQDRLREYEQREHTVPKPRDRKTPQPQPQPQPQLVDPNDASDGNCDEVSCVLNNYGGTCCLKYRKGTAIIHKAPDIPDSLDRSSISSAMTAIKGDVATCGARFPAKGIVKVQVRVGADGRVTDVVITSTPAAKLGACVASVVQRTKFERTLYGGSFTYPFVF